MSDGYQNLTRAEMRKYVPETAKRLLDVGCNSGGFGAGLKECRSIEIWGIEPNPIAANEAAKVLDHVITGIFDPSINIPEDFFDVVCFNDSLEHIADPWSALLLAKSKLRPGGTLAVSVPNMLNRWNLQHMLIDRDFRYERDGIRDRTHLRFFTLKSIQAMLEECGLQIVTAEGINEDWYSHSLLVRVLYRLLRNKLNETKFRQIAVVATRPSTHDTASMPAMQL